MSRPVCARFCHGRGADKTYRSFSFNNPSCITGTINVRNLQQQQINTLKFNGSYQEVLSLNKESRKELQWWTQNLKLCNGRLIIQHQSFVIIKTDAFKKGWCAFCQEIPTGGEWKSEEKEMHINILELKAVIQLQCHFTNK